jgi:acetyl-CoA carboxylase biotin carboxyl carrier protein
MMKFEEIKELVHLFKEGDITKINIKQKDFEIRIEKEAAGGVIQAAPVHAQPIAAIPTPKAAAVQASHEEVAATPQGDSITSPMVGTFYSSPSPSTPAFVKVGSKVSKGTTLCILEAMKIMNELEAEFDCTILEILAKDGDPVEYGMPLFIIEKA